MLITPLLHSPSSASQVVTDKLVLHLDSSNPLSYDSKASPVSKVWKDISSPNSTKIGTFKADVSYQPWHGGYIQFDGTDDWVDFAANDDLKFNKLPFSVMFFFRLNSFGGTMVDFRNGTNAAGFNEYNYSSNGARFGCWSREKKKSYWESSFRLTTGTWYSIAYVRNGSNFKVYVDTVLDQTQSNEADFDSWSDTLRLGSNIQGDGCHCDIGTVLVYKDKALSAAEVTQNHQACIARFKT